MPGRSQTPYSCTCSDDAEVQTHHALRRVCHRCLPLKAVHRSFSTRAPRHGVIRRARPLASVVQLASTLSLHCGLALDLALLLERKRVLYVVTGCCVKRVDKAG